MLNNPVKLCGPCALGCDGEHRQLDTTSSKIPCPRQVLSLAWRRYPVEGEDEIDSI